MDHPNPIEKWKNMRRMAWIAFLHALVMPFVLEGDILMYMLYFDALVVGAYMGFSTARDGWGDK
tara:strand:- start:18674 stop:18865 length:192 start_codon:yes stop_codon:yes gene_type:complete